MRLEIYEMALLDLPQDLYLYFQEGRLTGRRAGMAPIFKNFTFPKLLHASRQVRCEMLPIFLRRLSIAVHIDLEMRGATASTAKCFRNQALLFKSCIAGLGKVAAKDIEAFRLQIWGIWYRQRRPTTDGPKLPETKIEILEDLGLHETGIEITAIEIDGQIRTGDGEALQELRLVG